MPFYLQLLLGLFVGTLGTLIGAGGGFILVPLFLYIYPERTPEIISALSITVVFLNAFSGTVAYAKKKKVDWKNGIFFALAAIPGAILGTQLIGVIPRHLFAKLLAIVLLVSSVLMLLKNFSIKFSQKEIEKTHAYGIAQKVTNKRLLGLGGILSFVVGIISSILGIGGGIIHVPALIFLLGYSVTIATATSHFVLTLTSFVAVVSHYMQGHLHGNITEALIIGGGAVVGAQLGAFLSQIINPKKIVLVMAIALSLTALRLLLL